jgi:hypothetical protein
MSDLRAIPIILFFGPTATAQTGFALGLINTVSRCAAGSADADTHCERYLLFRN